MADEVLKKIAENKIKELEKEISALEGELKSMESFHSAANKSKIRMEINLGRRDIIFLRKFTEGRIDISREEQLKKNSVEVSGKIAGMQDSKKLIDGELFEIVVIKNLLAVTF